jgi:hypothetical protein
MTREPSVLAGGAERPVDRRRDLPAHLGRLAVPRSSPRRLQPPDRRLGDGRPHARRAGRRRATDGRGTPAPACRAHPPLRPRIAARLAGRRPGAQATGIARSVARSGDCYATPLPRASSPRSRRSSCTRHSWPMTARPPKPRASRRVDPEPPPRSAPDADRAQPEPYSATRSAHPHGWGVGAGPTRRPSPHIYARGADRLNAQHRTTDAP